MNKGEIEMPIDSEVYSKLKELFGNSNVEPEWSVTKNMTDDFENGAIYSPRLDFAIKPFNTSPNFTANIEKIDHAYRRKSGIFEPYISNSEFDFEQNLNPRCFVAVEVESNSPTRKHKIGSIINAAAIGKVGIVLGTDEKAYKTLIRIKNYVSYIFSHKKLKIPINNVIILSKHDFLDI